MPLRNLPNDHRFKGILVDEYHLIKLAYPHLDEFQGIVGMCVKNFHTVSSSKNLTVLEIGCGDGITTNVILDSRKDIDLKAIDIEINMIEKAKYNLQSHENYKNVQLIVEDALTYIDNTPDNSVDIIASTWTLHNFLNLYRFQFLKSAFRSLKPGGILINADKYAQQGESHHHALLVQMRRFFEAYLSTSQYGFLKDFVLHNIDDESPSRIIYELEYIRDMRAIGYSSIQCVYRELMEAVYIAYKNH